MLQGNRFCHSCCTAELSRKRQRSGVHICAECDPRRVDRIEVVVRPLLLASVAFPPSAADDTLFGQTCDVVRRRRPDLLWLGSDRAVVLEIDENGGHGSANYSPECDFGWVMDVTAALAALYQRHGWNEGRVPRVHVVRWNPDEYDRVRRVGRRVTGLFEAACDDDDPRPRIDYFFYHSKCRGHIEYAMTHPDAAVVRVLQ